MEVSWDVAADSRCAITLELRGPDGSIKTFATGDRVGTHAFEVLFPDGGEAMAAVVVREGSGLASRSIGISLPPCASGTRQEQGSGEEVETQWVGERPLLGPVVVPVVMYYLDRYFSGRSGGTAVDREIRGILDEAPDVRGFFQRALENYKAIPEEAKLRLFDPETVRLTRDAAERLDMQAVRDRIDYLSGGLVWKYRPPAAPSGLTAVNASRFEPARYQIDLNWYDLSDNEEGFLIYRAFKASGQPLGPFKPIAQVGANVTHFTDKDLSTPQNAADRYCYRISAFATASFNPVGKSPTRLESAPSGMACAYYAPGYPPPKFPDLDKDGFPDPTDECPGVPGIWPHGCPDKDQDGVPDKDDLCETEPMQWFSAPGYEDKGPPPALKGCPIRYTLRWMGMKVLNNSYALYSPAGPFIGPDGKAMGLYFNEVDSHAGEEPYLLFNWVNGMTAQGAAVHGSARWCCGEGVFVKTGQDYEPDKDPGGEEKPGELPSLRKYGLQVFPALPGKFASIDDVAGLFLSITLMERDWPIYVTPAGKMSELDAAFSVGGAVVGAISSCIGSSGLGCMASVGGALKSVVDAVYNLAVSSEVPPVQVKDPDDYQGTDVWITNRRYAQLYTRDNGVYAFYLDVPTHFMVSCLGWHPCPIQMATPVTMRARLYFCLYREGTPAATVEKACSSYAPVIPWPMVK